MIESRKYICTDCGRVWIKYWDSLDAHEFTECPDCDSDDFKEINED